MGGLARMFENKKQHGIATGDPDADAFLRENPNAILIGLLLDQQMRAEVAFSGPYKLHERLGHLDVERIAEMDTDDLGDVFGEKPAIHRFYNMMAGRVHTLAQYLTEHYDGDGSKLWEDGADAANRQALGEGPAGLWKIKGGRAAGSAHAFRIPLVRRLMAASAHPRVPLKITAPPPARA